MPIVLDGTAGISGAPISGTTGTFSGAVSGTTGTFSGNVTANGVATELRPLVPMTAQNTTSGTIFDFTGIPAWAKRVTVIFDQVSLSGTDDILVQLGTSGGLVITGYDSSSSGVTATNGMNVRVAIASRRMVGHMMITLISGNTWVSSSVVDWGGSTSTGGGRVALGGVLTQLRITRTGTDTFDLGAVNVMYE